MHINKILEKLKTKLIAKDFTQIFEINYGNTFVLIVKFDILQIFLIIVILKNLKCYQINVNNIFIKSFFKKKIYIIFLFKVNISLEQCLRIFRSFYNLKQVVRNQHKHYVKKFAKLNFKQCNVNLYLLLHFKQRIILLLYINNIVIVIQLISNVD